MWAQAALQVAADPTSWSTVQGSPSSAQLVGQVDAGSQVSPAWTWRSPQTPPQSLSLAAVHPAGQHRSPPAQAVTGTCEQARVQPSVVPRAKSSVHGSLSAHEAGHAPACPAVIPLSQTSGGSRTPFPHRGLQSESVVALHSGGQQASPSAQVVMGWRTQ